MNLPKKPSMFTYIYFILFILVQSHIVINKVKYNSYNSLFNYVNWNVQKMFRDDKLVGLGAGALIKEVRHRITGTPLPYIWCPSWFVSGSIVTNFIRNINKYLSEAFKTERLQMVQSNIGFELLPFSLLFLNASLAILWVIYFS